MAMARCYPDPNWTGLRTAISVVHGIDSSAILCGAGTMELIGAISRCYLGEGDRALVSEYGYAFFKTAALSVGACCDSALSMSSQ